MLRMVVPPSVCTELAAREPHSGRPQLIKRFLEDHSSPFQASTVTEQMESCPMFSVIDIVCNLKSRRCFKGAVVSRRDLISPWHPLTPHRGINGRQIPREVWGNSCPNIGSDIVFLNRPVVFFKPMGLWMNFPMGTRGIQVLPRPAYPTEVYEQGSSAWAKG